MCGLVRTVSSRWLLIAPWNYLVCFTSCGQLVATSLVFLFLRVFCFLIKPRCFRRGWKWITTRRSNESASCRKNTPSLSASLSNCRAPDLGQRANSLVTDSRLCFCLETVAYCSVNLDDGTYWGDAFRCLMLSTVFCCLLPSTRRCSLSYFKSFAMIQISGGHLRFLELYCRYYFKAVNCSKREGCCCFLNKCVVSMKTKHQFRVQKST